jgi:superfamily I DNA/RNA helicase
VNGAIYHFMSNPDHPGLNLEPIHGDKTRRLHTIRASKSIRVLLAKEGNVYVLLEAGQHDDIYDRANRLRFLANPHTGFVGLIPIDVSPDEQQPAPPRQTSERDAVHQPGVMDHWADQDLAAAGFQPDEITAVRRCTAEEELCDLEFPGLKIELIIDLLELTPEQWRTPPIDPAADAEQRIRAAISNSTESFSALFGPEEAKRIATAPIEDWMVFLHPDQRDAVNRRQRGPARVRGSAGTGKTVVALHRAAALARRFEDEEGGGRILFTTFIRSLPPVFESLYRRLPGARPEAAEFVNVDKLAYRICSDSGDRPNLDTRSIDAAFAAAYKEVVVPGSPLAGLTRQYLRDEITAVIKGRGIRSLDEYLAIERTGRTTRFTEPLRRQAWRLHETWTAHMHARGTIDFPDVIIRARDHARRRPQPTYRAAIVDEAQDLTLVGLQLVRTLVNGPEGADRPDGLLVVGDGAQKIYAGGFTLRQAGVEVRGRTTILRTNYRNTRQIIDAAMAVAGDFTVDDLGDEQRRGDARADTVRDGIAPVLATCGSHEDELAFIVRQVKELTSSGAVRSGDLAVAVATNALIKTVRAALDAASIPVQLLDQYVGQHVEAVKVGTHFRIKGLEFKVVFLPFLGSAEFPRAQLAGQDDAEYAEQRVLAVNQLFVAMTRARDGLYLVCTGEPSTVIEPGMGAFDVL